MEDFIYGKTRATQEQVTGRLLAVNKNTAFSANKNTALDHQKNWKLYYLLLEYPFPMFKPVTVTRHIEKFTLVHQPVQHG